MAPPGADEWPPRGPRWQVALVAIGVAALLLQIAVLPLKGTGDVRTFKEWGVGSLHTGLPAAYRGAETPDGVHVAPDYPPLGVIVLSATARAVQFVFGPITVDSRLLTVYIKLLALASGLFTSCLLWWHVRSRTDDAWLAFVWGVVYFANPARIVNGPVLGYLDGPCLALGMAGLVCAGRARPMAGAVLAVLGALIKPQGVFFLLPVAVMAWGSGRVLRAATAAAATVVLVCLPFVVVSGPYGFAQAMLINLREDMLSGNALNLWWLVTVIMRIGQLGWDVFDVRLSLVSVSHFSGITGVEPRLFMAAVVIGLAAWMGWRLRGTRRVADVAAYMALVVHIYFVLAISVHENHLIYAVAPLLIAAVDDREYRRLAVAISLLTAMNMAMFYGIGRDWPEIPRVGLFLPLTVVLAGANVWLLAAHARVYARRGGVVRAPVALPRSGTLSPVAASPLTGSATRR